MMSAKVLIRPVQVMNTEKAPVTADLRIKPISLSYNPPVGSQ